MASPNHYPSPGDQYVLMPIREGQDAIEQADLDGAQAYAEEHGYRIVKLLGTQDTEGLGNCLVFLAVPIKAYEDSVHGVLAVIEAQASVTLSNRGWGVTPNGP